MESFNTIKNLSIDQLKEKYDNIAKKTNPGISFYQDEIARRESEKLNLKMLEMTKQMRNMTIAISIMTLVNILLRNLGLIPRRLRRNWLFVTKYPVACGGDFYLFAFSK